MGGLHAVAFAGLRKATWSYSSLCGMNKLFTTDKIFLFYALLTFKTNIECATGY